MKYGLLFLFALNSWVESAQVIEKPGTTKGGGEVVCMLYRETRPHWPVEVWYGIPEDVKRSAADRAMLQYVVDRLDFSVLGCTSVEGVIVVQFTVEADGRVTDPQLVRKLYPPLDEQVLEIVASFPRFVPGRQTHFQEDGTPILRGIKTQLYLPVRIRLE